MVLPSVLPHPYKTTFAFTYPLYGVIYRSKRIKAIATHFFTVATHLELNCAAFEGSFATHLKDSFAPHLKGSVATHLKAHLRCI